MSVGELIKLARKQRGISQTVLADLIGVSTRTLRRYERGDAIPDDSSAQLLAENLKLDSGHIIQLCEIERGLFHLARWPVHVLSRSDQDGDAALKSKHRWWRMTLQHLAATQSSKAEGEKNHGKHQQPQTGAGQT